MWDARDGCRYNVYRAETASGRYELIGSTGSGSFRDSDADWPRAGFYRIEPVYFDGSIGTLSDPIQAGTNPQHVSTVAVVMYHNFITQADIANGVVFEGYSLDPLDFEPDLQWLRDSGYTTIIFGDVIDYIR